MQPIHVIVKAIDEYELCDATHDHDDNNDDLIMMLMIDDDLYDVNIIQILILMMIDDDLYDVDTDDDDDYIDADGWIC